MRFTPDGEAKVRIDRLEVIESTLARRQVRFVLAWAELHQVELEENWRRARGEMASERVNDRAARSVGDVGSGE